MNRFKKTTNEMGWIDLGTRPGSPVAFNLSYGVKAQGTSGRNASNLCPMPPIPQSLWSGTNRTSSLTIKKGRQKRKHHQKTPTKERN